MGELVGVIAVHTADGLATPECLTKAEVARAIGTSVRQIERLIAAGTLGSVRVGRARYVTREQLDLYRAQHHVQPELDLAPIQRGNDD